MTDDDKPHPVEVSRRRFLWTAAVGTGSVIGLSLMGTPARAGGKMSQKAVQYQPIPKHGNRCVDCALWQTPASCKAVEGPISPAGWCTLFAPKG